MKVIFRKDKETKEIIAFFPETYSNGFLDSYVHIGQHSIASIQYYKETEKAKETEYQNLLKELYSIGYDSLKIMSKMIY